jgi:hypothetical protein
VQHPLHVVRHSNACTHNTTSMRRVRVRVSCVVCRVRACVCRVARKDVPASPMV